MHEYVYTHFLYSVLILIKLSKIMLISLIFGAANMTLHNYAVTYSWQEVSVKQKQFNATDPVVYY
jgi:hypothetical protein